MTRHSQRYNFFKSLRFRALMFLSVIALIVTISLAGIWKSSLHDMFADYAERWSSNHLSTLGTSLVPFLIQNSGDRKL